MCPFVDKSDVRCAAHMTLRNVLQAFQHCADRYGECPVYAQLVRNVADIRPQTLLALS